jgi:hypothetical protein
MRTCLLKIKKTSERPPRIVSACSPQPELEALAADPCPNASVYPKLALNEWEESELDARYPRIAAKPADSDYRQAATARFSYCRWNSHHFHPGDPHFCRTENQPLASAIWHVESFPQAVRYYLAFVISFTEIGCSPQFSKSTPPAHEWSAPSNTLRLVNKQVDTTPFYDIVDQLTVLPILPSYFLWLCH